MAGTREREVGVGVGGWRRELGGKSWESSDGSWLRTTVTVEEHEYCTIALLELEEIGAK